nr:hypothetical protein CFP56_77900 [Quercus suber]
MWDPQVYVGGKIDIVDNCDPDKWSKVEIESICREFGYTEVDKLWYKMPGVNPEHTNFHQVVDDDAAMFMTDLVKGYGEIHVFVEHPVHEPVEVPDSELEGVGVDVEYAEYGDEEYRPDFSQFGGHDNAEFTNVDHGKPHEVDVEQVCARRAGKSLVVDDQVEESTEGSEDEMSDLEEKPKIQLINIGEDSTDSWDNQAEDDEVEPRQMGGGVMNSNYESEELLSLDESSSSSEDGDDSSDDDIQEEEGIKFVKNDLVRVRARCQPGCKFVAYLAKDAVHEKYVVNISAGKASRAREKAQDAVDGAHTAQFNQLCEYCDELRRCSPGSTVLMKLECIRLYLMTRFQANREMIMKVESELCPKIRKRLYKEKLACRHNKRSCKGEVGGNSSLPGSASQASRTTRRVAKDGHANSPAVGSAHPAKDVTTSAPPPPTDNQSNPRPTRQRKRGAVTTETLNATGNAARYMAAMRSTKR